MVNMNLYKDPAIYGLTFEGRVFYVGRTGSNALNRWWQHRYRARTGHSAPVYQWMRKVGIDNVGWTVLTRLGPEDDARALESKTIADLLEAGNDLVNEFGLDGRPDSWSPAMRDKYRAQRAGKPTWIKGKRGVDAGWTDERRKRQSEARKVAWVLPHGTPSGYARYGCRCEACCEARRAQLARGRSQPVVLPHERPTPKWKIHGEVACYKNGKCRCDLCTEAYRVYKRGLPKR